MGTLKVLLHNGHIYSLFSESENSPILSRRTFCCSTSLEYWKLFFKNVLVAEIVSSKRPNSILYSFLSFTSFFSVEFSPSILILFSWYSQSFIESRVFRASLICSGLKVLSKIPICLASSINEKAILTPSARTFSASFFSRTSRFSSFFFWVISCSIFRQSSLIAPKK